MLRRLPPLNALVVFEAAARHLSFTRAADSLHVTQAAVSHQMKALEEWLGVSLFHRLGRGQGLVLTEAGRAYLPRVSGALDTIRAATTSIVDSGGKHVLNVAMLDSFGLLWLLPRLRNFTRQYPTVDVRILTAEVDTDAVGDGSVDIDIRYGAGDWSGVEVTQFLTEAIFPVCSPEIITEERPLRTPQDLSRHTLLHDVMVTDWRAWFEAAQVEGIDSDRGPGFNHSHLVTMAAIHGDGVALGRGALVTDAIRKGQLVKPFNFTMPSKFGYYVVCSRGGAEDPSIAAFREWLIAEGAASQSELDSVRDGR